MSSEYQTRRRSSAFLNEAIIEKTSTLNVKQSPLFGTTTTEETLFPYDRKDNSCSMNHGKYNFANEKSSENNDNPVTVIHNVHYHIMCCFQLFSFGANYSHADNSKEDTKSKWKFSNLTTWFKEKLDDEIFTTQKTLFLFFVDWVLDFGTAISHFSNGNWIEGALTYLIVLFAGTVTTCGFLKYKEIREYLQKDTRAAGLWLFILLHLPSWFLFVCLKRKLDWLKKKRHCDRNRNSISIVVRTNEKDDETGCKEDVDENLNKYCDWTLKATWLDTVLEAKPQALLQTIFLFETSFADFNIRDYVPLLLSLWTIHSITKNIYAIVLNEAVEDKTPTFSKLYGYTYTVLSNMAPAMCINTARNQYETETEKFFITIGTLIAYYVFLAIVERITFFTSNRSNISYGKVFHTFMGMIFICCLCLWVVFSENLMYPSSWSLKSIIIISLYLTSFVMNIVGFLKAMEFAEVSFRLKNDMIKKQSQEFRNKIKSLLS